MNELAYPFDIIATTFGFFILGGSKDTSNLWIASYKYSGTLIWKRIIMKDQAGALVAKPS